jgi:hypothetical protein
MHFLALVMVPASRGIGRLESKASALACRSKANDHGARATPEHESPLDRCRDYQRARLRNQGFQP